MASRSWWAKREGTAVCSASIPQAVAVVMLPHHGAAEAPAAAAAMAALATLLACWHLAPAQAASTWLRLGLGVQEGSGRREGAAAAVRKARRVGPGCRSRKEGTLSVPRADRASLCEGSIVLVVRCMELPLLTKMQGVWVSKKLCLGGRGWVAGWVGDVVTSRDIACFTCLVRAATLATLLPRRQVFPGPGCVRKLRFLICGLPW
jgi:hypothetical protein